MKNIPTARMMTPNRANGAIDILIASFLYWFQYILYWFQYNIDKNFSRHRRSNWIDFLRSSSRRWIPSPRSPPSRCRSGPCDCLPPRRSSWGRLSDLVRGYEPHSSYGFFARFFCAFWTIQAAERSCNCARCTKGTRNSAARAISARNGNSKSARSASGRRKSQTN